MNFVEKINSNIVEHYEQCFELYGDNFRGVDWDNKKNAQIRYSIMMDIIPSGIDKVDLLDFGCGLSHLYSYMLLSNILEKGRFSHVNYFGSDASDKFITMSRKKFPNITYYKTPVIIDSWDLSDFDYVIMNGVFTEKNGLTFDESFEFLTTVLKVVFPHVKKGIAFNVMSKHVDWERDDLFHLSFDVSASFLRDNLSKNYSFRSDYGLYEYTTYVYKEEE